VLESETQSRSSAENAVEVFAYAPCPGVPASPVWSGWVEVSDRDATEPAHEHGKRHDGAACDSGPSARSGDSMQQSFAAGRERGRQEGRQAEREAQALALAAEEERRKRQLAGLTEIFVRERDRLLQAAEQEVVNLSLAVAARILRREAHMDPLLLTGAVRVALGQLAGSCEVRLKVPAAEIELWTEAIALIPNLSTKPIVIAGDGMRLGDCVIESKAGTVDLGVRSQLAEIERGFFDRSSSSEQKPIAPRHAKLTEVEP
jgi:flagellar biosynthesis/type III secretory pathway protein FliH